MTNSFDKLFFWSHKYYLFLQVVLGLLCNHYFCLERFYLFILFTVTLFVIPNLELFVKAI